MKTTKFYDPETEKMIDYPIKPTNTTKKISETLLRWDFGQVYSET